MPVWARSASVWLTRVKASGGQSRAQVALNASSAALSEPLGNGDGLVVIRSSVLTGRGHAGQSSPRWDGPRALAVVTRSGSTCGWNVSDAGYLHDFHSKPIQDSIQNCAESGYRAVILPRGGHDGYSETRTTGPTAWSTSKDAVPRCRRAGHRPPLA